MGGHRGRLDGAALGDDDPVARGRHRRRQVAPLVAHADQRGPADDRAAAARVAPGVARDHRHLEPRPLVAHRLPEGAEILVAQRGRQVEIDRGVGGRDAAGPQVGGQQVAGEPRRGGGTEARDHRERIGGERHHPPGAEPDHGAIAAHRRSDQHLGARGAQMGRDQALEDGGRELAERRPGAAPRLAARGHGHERLSFIVM